MTCVHRRPARRLRIALALAIAVPLLRAAPAPARPAASVAPAAWNVALDFDSTARELALRREILTPEYRPGIAEAILARRDQVMRAAATGTLIP
jgi:hypothetical protein